MTAEQAIKELKSDRELYGSEIVYAGDGTPEGDLMLALDMGIAALEKQIPKKPVMVGEEYIFERDEWEKDYECPFCGNPYADDSFCSCCGQKLDWSDNNA